ncbi:hypothetical protein [Streptomyces sp. cmx-4-7]|uniref:hypothetical protein n=1 Tax=Streptomyces sp. cmx-4-7 TaxID=2790939 RepID=UPI0039804950
MFEEEARPEFLELEPTSFMSDLVERGDIGKALRGSVVGLGLQADLVIFDDSRAVIVECKSVRPQTRHRIGNLIAKLKRCHSPWALLLSNLRMENRAYSRRGSTI